MAKSTTDSFTTTLPMYSDQRHHRRPAAGFHPLCPIVGIAPGVATAPALIFVGVLMLSNIRDVDFSNMQETLPAFCTIIFVTNPRASSET